MHADERDYLSGEMRRRLEDAFSRPTLDFLVSTLRLANDAENLEYLGRLLMSEAWNMRARSEERADARARRATRSWRG